MNNKNLSPISQVLLWCLQARFTFRYAAFEKNKINHFAILPQPETIGSIIRGKKLLQGEYTCAEKVINTKERSLWAALPKGTAYTVDAHAFGWLEDLAAVGNRQARQIALNWIGEWITHYGHGQGPGWKPIIVANRLIRWLQHSHMLLKKANGEISGTFFGSLMAQTRYLSSVSHSFLQRSSTEQAKVLIAVIYAGLALEGDKSFAMQKISTLTNLIANIKSNKSHTDNRNPEDLLELATLLDMVRCSVIAVNHVVPQLWIDMLEHEATVLRNLRHKNGSLPVFHGGTIGKPGQLDRLLANFRENHSPNQPFIETTTFHRTDEMGYIRLSAGQVSLALDATSPPKNKMHGKKAKPQAIHSSTLSFDIVSGNHPLIVNCGEGTPFGTGWIEKSQETSSYSTLSIDGFSSSNFGQFEFVQDDSSDDHHGRNVQDIQIRHAQVTDLSDGNIGSVLRLAHNGWVKTHGLSHERMLNMSCDGTEISGSDALFVARAEDAKFSLLQEISNLGTATFSVRFHLHPKTKAQLKKDGEKHVVALTLPSRETWVLSSFQRIIPLLEPSVYFDPTQIHPVPTVQIVLRDIIRGSYNHISWTLAQSKVTSTTKTPSVLHT